MLFLSAILFLVAWIWIIVTAFKSEQIVWGVVMILFFPAMLLYGILHWSKVTIPFIMLLISFGLMFTISPQEVDQLR